MKKSNNYKRLQMTIFDFCPDVININAIPIHQYTLVVKHPEPDCIATEFTRNAKDLLIKKETYHHGNTK